MKRTTPITDYARFFTLNPNVPITQIQNVIMRYVLHICDNYIARGEIKALVSDSPSAIGEILSNLRGDIETYSWKICALSALQGNPGMMGRSYLQGMQQLKDVVRFAPLIPNVIQPLCLQQGERILHQALRDVTPVMKAAQWRVRFVDNLLQGNSAGMLYERALLTFRWEYPFVNNPGACLNTAINNYAKNIARDSGSKRRCIFTGKKSEGNLTNILVHDYDNFEEEAVPVDDDITVDFANLDAFDQKVVYAILSVTDMVGEELVVSLSSMLDVTELHIRESMDRIGIYLMSGKVEIPDLGQTCHVW